VHPVLYICRKAKPCCRGPSFEGRACEDQWCQLVVDGKKGLFSLSALITPGVSWADMLALVIQKYSCPLAAAVRSRSKGTEIIGALL